MGHTSDRVDSIHDRLRKVEREHDLHRTRLDLLDGSGSVARPTVDHDCDAEVADMRVRLARLERWASEDRQFERDTVKKLKLIEGGLEAMSARVSELHNIDMSGQIVRACDDCGNEFTPNKNWHAWCESCAESLVRDGIRYRRQRAEKPPSVAQVSGGRWSLEVSLSDWVPEDTMPELLEVRRGEDTERYRYAAVEAHPVAHPSDVVRHQMEAARDAMRSVREQGPHERSVVASLSLAYLANSQEQLICDVERVDKVRRAHVQDTIRTVGQWWTKV